MKRKRYRAPNYSVEGEKCAQNPQVSVAGSISWKNKLMRAAYKLNMSLSAYVRLAVAEKMERENDAEAA